MQEHDGTHTAAPRGTRRLWNLPNMLSGIRLAGSLALIGMALLAADRPIWFTGLLVFLLMTDWLDGKMAILLKQQTTFGARLDTVADVALYAALLFGLVWLKREVVAAEAAWIATAVTSYAISALASWFKFGRLPSYHSRAAKTSWLLVSLAAIALLAGGAVWPLRVAAAAVVATNMEAIAITCVLRKPQVNVISLFHAWKHERSDS